MLCVVCCVCACGVGCVGGLFLVPSVRLSVFACFLRRGVFVCSVYDVSCGVV